MDDNFFTSTNGTHLRSAANVAQRATGAVPDDGTPFPPVHPGFTLAEFLEERSLDVGQCAKRCGLPARVIQDLLDGTIPVDGAIAAALEAGGFGPSAEYWLGKERLYQEALEHYGQTRPEHTSVKAAV